MIRACSPQTGPGQPLGVAAGPDDPGLFVVLKALAGKQLADGADGAPEDAGLQRVEGAAAPGRRRLVGMDQGKLRGEEVKGAGAEEEPRGDHPALPDACGSDPLDRDRGATRDDQARLAGGHVRQGCQDGQGPVCPAGLGALDVHLERDIGGRLIPGGLVDVTSLKKGRQIAARRGD